MGSFRVNNIMGKALSSDFFLHKALCLYLIFFLIKRIVLFWKRFFVTFFPAKAFPSILLKSLLSN